MRPALEWLIGVVLALAVIATAFFPFVFVYAFVGALAIALVITLGAHRFSAGGGVLLPVGLWMTWIHFDAIQRCAEAQGSCTVVDASGTAAPAIAFVFAGAVLSLYGLGKRSARGGE